MIPSALMAWLHYMCIFSAIGLLVAEFILYRRELSEPLARRFALLDGIYGIAALGIVGSGFARAAWFEKGWAYYQFHPVFWTKVCVYILWALFSLPPTVHFLKLRKRDAVNGIVSIDPSEYRRVRACMVAQLLLVPVPPLLAALLARGVGAVV